MSIRKQIIRNVLSGWGYYAVQLVIGFFLMPYMIHRLGIATYGVWTLLMSLVGYVGFVDFRVRGAIGKYVAEYHASNNMPYLNKILNVSFICSVVLGLLIILFSAIFAFYADKIFILNQTLVNDFKISSLIIGVNISLVLCCDIYAGILEGTKRQDIVSNIEIITFMVQTFLFILCLNKGYGLIALSLSLLIANISRQIIRAFFTFRLFPHFKLHFEYMFDRSVFKKIFSYSFYLYLFESVRGCISVIPTAILGAFIGSSSITFYSIASRLSGYTNIFSKSAADTVMPFASTFQATKDVGRLKKVFMDGSRYSYMVIIFICTCSLMCGRPFINLWMGNEYVYPSYQLLCIMVVPLAFMPSMFISISIMKGLGIVKNISLLSIAEAVTGSTLAILLIKPFGVFGVALGFAVPLVVIYGVIMPALLRKELLISFGEYAKHVFSPLFLPAAALVLFMLFFNYAFYPSSFLNLIIEVAIAIIFFGAMCYFFVMQEEERVKLASIFNRKLQLVD